MGIKDAPIRWIVDDCVKFVEREIRRGNHYDAIIMDPPSYGRGPKGEIWKIEEAIHPLIKLCAKLLSDDPLFFLVNSYTTGLAPAVLTYMIATELKPFTVMWTLRRSVYRFVIPDWCFHAGLRDAGSGNHCKRLVLCNIIMRNRQKKSIFPDLSCLFFL